jgi:3-hydroxyacyl-CoA dehydrogenase
VGGLHFFNPVPVMKLLEVVKADQTSEATMEAMISWGRAIGKLSTASLPQCCGSGSGIRCLFDPWIRDPE